MESALQALLYYSLDVTALSERVARKACLETRSKTSVEWREATIKAVVFHSIGDIRLDEVADPQIEQPTDAIVRLTASAICGTDFHIVRGTMRGMKPGTVLGHEGVGIVQEVGRDVRNLNKGDRVVIPSTIACGYCSYCRDGC